MVNAIKEARIRAGLSQAELALTSGVARPNIAAYEIGRRHPSQQMLERLVAAAKPRPSVQLKKYRVEISVLADTNGLRDVRVIGSTARGTDTPESDLDLLVTPDSGTGFFAISRFMHAVEDLLGVEVDVVSSGGLRESHARIERDAVPL